jgi:hypothetical protein
MSLTHRSEVQAMQAVNGAILEKVLLENDFSKLSPVEKVQHVKNICDSLGLNPLTRPIQILKFNGKEVPYCTKDATEQLRKNHKVSITSLDTKILDGSTYVVTAHAQMPDGRTDSSTGVIAIGGLKGEALANAMMKAETKAKRRTTLSICGLGFLDESEIDSIPNAKVVNLESDRILETKVLDMTSEAALQVQSDKFLFEIETADSLDKLKKVFSNVKMIDWGKSDYLKMLIDAKDKRKLELEHGEWVDKFDSETGEVKQ